MRGTNESKGNKIKDFDSFDIMFFIYSNKQNALVLVYEIYQPYPSRFCDVEQHYQIRARATK